MRVSVQKWNERDPWNQFVASVPGGHFQQGWEWGELGPSLGGEAVRLAACQDGHIVGAMQVFVSRVRGTAHTHLLVPRGPVLRQANLQVLSPLLDSARSLGTARHSLGIRLEPNAARDDQRLAAMLSQLGYHPSYPPSQPRSVWVLDISSDEDILLRQMKQKTRYNIRLALRRGVEVEAAGLDQLDAFYELYRETALRDDFFVHDESIYRAMFGLYQRTDNFRMLFARYQGRALAAVTLIRLGGTCWYMHGASSNADRNLMAPYLLQWEAVRQAKQWGCTLYDFRGVPDMLRSDQDMYGVYRFKEGFGGRQFTAMNTYAAAYRPGLFGLWQAYYSGRFALQAARRRRAGLTVRQFA